MVDAFPPLSPALGFWVKHQEAMVAFEYEHDDDTSVPDELRKVFESDRYRGLLDQILEVSDEEGNALVHAIANATAAIWARHPTLVIERRRTASDWSEKFFVRRKWRKGDSLEVGFQLRANSQLGPTLHVYLWTKGGKAAAEFNAQCIQKHSNEKVLKGADDRTRHWVNGVLLLGRISLRDFMTAAGELETAKFFDEAVAQVAKCTGDAVAEILESRG